MARLGVMHDVLDGQLEAADGRRVGRVVDARCEVLDSGELRVADLALGPEAAARRIGPWAARLARRMWSGRHERLVAMSEVVAFGPTLRLRESADAGKIADGDAWAVALIRWIPGSGVRESPRTTRSGPTADASPRNGVWLSELIGAEAIGHDGSELGRVSEVHIGPHHHRITHVVCGVAGWVDRLGLTRVATALGWLPTPQPVPWARIDSLADSRLSTWNGKRRAP